MIIPFSMLCAVRALKTLMTKKEQQTWIKVTLLTIITASLEILTASMVVIFAQVLTHPDVGQKYLRMVGVTQTLSQGRIIFYVAISLGATYLIKNFMFLAELFYQYRSIQNFSYRLKKTLLHRYAEFDYGVHLTRNSSFGIQIVETDVEQSFSSGLVAISIIFSESLIFLALVSMIVWMNFTLAFIVFILGGSIFLGVSKRILPSMYRIGQKLQEIQLCSHKNISQFFQGFKEIILLRKKNFFIDSYQRYALEKSQIQVVQAVFNTLPRVGIEILFVGSFVITIAVLCLKHESPMHMMGMLGGYFYVGFRLMPGLNRIISQLSVFKSVIPHIESLHREYNQLVQKESYQDLVKFKFNETITLNHVYFRYLNTSKDALEDICLTIQKGERIGIVGTTGSGKSTLIDIMLGLLMPYKGSVFIDKAYPVNSYQWHKEIGYVAQSIYLSDDTIKANIAFGEIDVDEARLNVAINTAQLRGLITSLPNGENTFTGERGVRLSGGERQRIAIARALYHNPSVLVFDEATSALDGKTESTLMEMVDQVSANRTVIMIAHRISTLAKCNRIVVMEKGRIKEITNYHDIQHRIIHHG